MSEISYDITKKMGIIGESTKGWKKEFNLISWNGRDAKYDIRDWSEGNEKMGKGVTLSKEELSELKKILNTMDL